MKKATFHFKLEAKGALEDVQFIPEDSGTSIKIQADTDDKVWENKRFELVVDNPLDYELIVFGVSNTRWEAELTIIDANNTEADFLSWSGITGDTSNNISRRRKPNKDIP